ALCPAAVGDVLADEAPLALGTSDGSCLAAACDLDALDAEALGDFDAQEDLLAAILLLQAEASGGSISRCSAAEEACLVAAELAISGAGAPADGAAADKQLLEALRPRLRRALGFVQSDGNRPPRRRMLAPDDNNPNNTNNTNNSNNNDNTNNINNNDNNINNNNNDNNNDNDNNNNNNDNSKALAALALWRSRCGANAETWAELRGIRGHSSEEPLIEGEVRFLFGVFGALAMAHHSCSPNARVQWDSSTRRMKLIAARAISPGDLVSRSYLDAGALLSSVAARRAALLEDWGFHCACSRCCKDETGPQEAWSDVQKE
ncbi:unnamed protein product, partial [Polarella glacialis]